MVSEQNETQSETILLHDFQWRNYDNSNEPKAGANMACILMNCTNHTWMK